MEEGIDGLVRQAKALSRGLGGTDFSSMWEYWGTGGLLVDSTSAPPGVREAIDRINKLVKTALKGNTLVDLGASFPDRDLEKFLRRAELGTYIAVDLNVDPGKGLNPIDIPGTEVRTYQADMLEFASGLPPNSANFMLCGIDDIIIPLPKYHQALAQVVLDRTKPGGVILTSCSNISGYLCPSPQIQVLDWRDDVPSRYPRLDTNTFIFLKKEK